MPPDPRFTIRCNRLLASVTPTPPAGPDAPRFTLRPVTVLSITTIPAVLQDESDLCPAAALLLQLVLRELA